MWPDCASRQLEISPSTQMSVKFLPSRSRMRAVSSLTVRARRVGCRLKVSWLMEGDRWKKLKVESSKLKDEFERRYPVPPTPPVFCKSGKQRTYACRGS